MKTTAAQKKLLAELTEELFVWIGYDGSRKAASASTEVNLKVFKALEEKGLVSKQEVTRTPNLRGVLVEYRLVKS